ncbi:MAG: hypothetical protein WCX73_01335 [Candidatus Pacearchaeota archaeon]|jgi:hypothetical protein
MKSKILYDSTIRTISEWEDSLNILRKGYCLKFPDEEEFRNLDSIQSHYFAIHHNNPEEIITRIRDQTKNKLGAWYPIVWNSVILNKENSSFYRIDTPRKVEIFRLKVLDKPFAWKEDRTLHNKGPKAIENLIDRMEELK